jgi:hypothetical protein
MEREVILDFACCSCKHSIGVTLKCSGKGLSACHAAVAAVEIPCPTCSSINELVFDPSGTVHMVRPQRRLLRIPMPSLN